MILTGCTSKAARETGHSHSWELTLAGCHGEAVLDIVGVGKSRPEDVVGLTIMVQGYMQATRRRRGIHQRLLS